MEKFTFASRSKDRRLYFIGVVLAFLGLLLPYVRIPDEGMFNVCTALAYFNEPGYAYISTHICITWLALLGAIIGFFLSKHNISDYVCWLLAASFGCAEFVAITLDYELNPFQWMFIGSYVAYAGMTLALVALVLQAVHIKKA